MPMTPSQKTNIKAGIAEALSKKNWPEVDLILQEFGAKTQDDWSGNIFSYSLKMLVGASDDCLIGLAEHLSLPFNQIDVVNEPAFWGGGKLRVFLSHLAKDKIYATELKIELEKYGIISFVAHEDIEPDSEWQSEIEIALKTCDALIAVLHEGFNESTWTDQEVGFALGRQVPVFSLRLGMAPYGLFGKKQAFKGTGKSVGQVAREFFDAYRIHEKTCEKMADVIVSMFCESPTYAASKQRLEWLKDIQTWKPAYSEAISKAMDSNSQISGSWGVPEAISRILNYHAGQS